MAKWTAMFYFIFLVSIGLNQSDYSLRLGVPKPQFALFSDERQSHMTHDVKCLGDVSEVEEIMHFCGCG